MEEPKKEEVKRTKVKVPKAKKYEELPEIPDYERPELEIYEESEFDPNKPGEKLLTTPGKLTEQGVESEQLAAEPKKIGLPKVMFIILICSTHDKLTAIYFVQNICLIFVIFFFRN